MLGWQRLAVTLGIATLLFLPMSAMWLTSKGGLLMRVFGVALAAMLAFGVIERWPARLPRWIARWALQVLVVAVTVPVTVLLIYLSSTLTGQPPFWRDPQRINGFAMMTFLGMLVAPWVAFGALVRQREAFAREQALAFELERSRLEHQALDARMRLVQAQVQPHFLFNTLANVRALVNAGSPRASAVLDSLIDYLRAAVPRLNEAWTTLGRELDLVRAYLDLMQLRMPDRLHFTLVVEEAARGLVCPPMTLLTLVENAVRHGIDPAEEGGSIDVRVELHAARCRVSVSDTGVGLGSGGSGSLGTGLSSLRERLQLAFGGDAQVRIRALEPHGVRAELDFPAQASATP
jgi:signal transduction histidine kinase